MAQELGPDRAQAADAISAGMHWTGVGCTAGRCATLLSSAVSLAMVSANFSDYLHAHPFALCMLWALDVPQLQLGDKASEASFQLLQL